ncbi:hypothetical protein [Lentibacillus cibarius]|uniref:hypothetical protein n=1 Tax=Lentibacillus cibarius TaxID=2583219 RepID=UPI001486E836|nr:hypothetical protein [Lentibacillus cibarius]
MTRLLHYFYNKQQNPAKPPKIKMTLLQECHTNSCPFTNNHPFVKFSLYYNQTSRHPHIHNSTAGRFNYGLAGAGVLFHRRGVARVVVGFALDDETELQRATGGDDVNLAGTAAQFLDECLGLDFGSCRKSSFWNSAG